MNIDMNVVCLIIEDGFFAAVAAIGFGSISNVPKNAFMGCALLAAMGHATRYAFMNCVGVGIVWACFVAALTIGVVSILASRWWHCPPESLSSPALLPMIPGTFAYRSVDALMHCIYVKGEQNYMHYFYQLNYNFMMTVIIIVLLVLGATLPIFMCGNIPFMATRMSKNPAIK